MLKRNKNEGTRKVYDKFRVKLIIHFYGSIMLFYMGITKLRKESKIDGSMSRMVELRNSGMKQELSIL